jgi:hypothetical protein
MSACLLNLGKLSEVSGLNTVLVSVENWWYSYYLFLLQISLLIGDVAEMEEMSFWKCDEILPNRVLLAYKQEERIGCVVPSVWDSWCK